ncbi:MAG TPA: beta-ketoacyl synthase N-terminal-like domain-containing protein, partial [Spongiibacteraceae bacterium]
MLENIRYSSSIVEPWNFLNEKQERFRLLAITPCEYPDVPLAQALLRYSGAAAVDIGRNPARWPQLFSQIEKNHSSYLGIRIADHVEITAAQVPESVGFVVIDASANISQWAARFLVIVQVSSIIQARAAIKAGAKALIAKGQESGGLIGDESSFILLQRILKLPEVHNVPVWCQGGIGLHTAAGVIAGGAYGVVLDSQLALLNESTLNSEIKHAVRAMDGSETRVLGGYQLYNRPGLPIAGCAELSAIEVRARLGNSDLEHFLPLGQDAALAKSLAAQCPNAEALLNSFRSSITAHILQAQALQPLAENSALAQAHGTRFPIAQGPMTRVSDTAAFAVAVAENGALPFLALSLMNASASRTLLEETQARIGDNKWGVGVLGFADPEILNPQLELIREFRPAVVLLAGGRPSQARPLIELGITTYLHVPSPGLLELFLKDGARHFVFEGRECGGHVGPRFSFVLWEQQLQLLLNFEHPEELHILFAGGIHDERSAAMIAVMAAPLTARGAKIGVLMGTAYIATREAVDCGAIVPNFQRQAVGSDQTVLIETAPGHAVRCLPSHFVRQFNEEKMRLRARGLDQQEIWKQLEELNIGRLRIATKGVERCGENLLEVDQQQQNTDGMYMIGQLIALREKVGSMAELHAAVTTGAMTFLEAVKPPTLRRAKNAEPIAIVGMECIYPGSPDLETFWANILAGKDLITEVPAERWNKDVYYREGAAQKGKSPSKWGGFIDAIAFDPLEFGIPPQSLAAVEPVQLLSLEVAKRALANAGYGDQQRFFDREKTAVIFGAESGMDLANSYAFRNLYPHYLGELPPELDAILPDLTEDSFPGVLVNVISGRIANRLGLSGVNYSVDSACASSLTAIELAVKELRAGSSDMVLAGGADFHNSINDFLMFASVGALSSKGRCRSFDNSADGICLGEGVGIVVLKRLDDAQRDGDRIYAVIDGIAGSSDGKGLGLTAPRKEGQKRALERAYWQAGVLPSEVGLVEAHGTGTVVGDKTELQTMTEIFTAGGALPAQIGLGSVKSQIGHTKCAAGIAGLIKISKALYHQVLPPTLHIDTPNSGYRAGSSPFALNKVSRPWFEKKTTQQKTLRAAVSAFGFGGANFHAVLSNYNAEPVRSGAACWNAELFVFRGENFANAQNAMRQFAEFLRASDAPLMLRDLSFTAECCSGGAIQCAFVAYDRDDLALKIQIAITRADHADIFYRETTDAGKIAFVFPGQGSQTPGMLNDLFVTFPHLHRLLEIDPHCASILFPPTAYDRAQQQAQQRAITDTRVAQPALGMVELAVIELFNALGIKPAMAAGHSYGELVALASAGCFDARTLLALSRQRGEAILAAAGSDPGKMAAVSCGHAELKEIFDADSGVVLANQNSTAQTVISGATAAIENALAVLKEKGIAAKAIETACAFHSPVVARAEPLFGRVLQNVAIAAPAFPVYSNTTTQPYQHDSDAIKYQLAQHVVSPVRFVEQIENMYADGARVFVEMGPKRVLSGLIKNILAARPHRIIAIDAGNQTGIGAFLSAIAQLAVINDDIDLSMLYAGRNPQRLDIDTPRTLPAACWMVNGGRAWPHKGSAPAYAGKPITEPLQINTSVKSGQTTQENAVIDYLNNMREAVRAQRDVLLGFLGHTPAPMHSTQPLARIESTVATSAAIAAETIAAPAIDHDVQATLLAIVSERTGYPSAMLDLDLDLEADLSIDSIKRVEII